MSITMLMMFLSNQKLKKQYHAFGEFVRFATQSRDWDTVDEVLGYETLRERLCYPFIDPIEANFSLQFKMKREGAKDGWIAKAASR